MFADYKLEILYQDEYIVVVNKPSGLLVHKSMIDRHERFYAMKMLRDQLGGKWVYPLHRLDKPTSGVLVFALSSEYAREFSKVFANHDLKKSYIAVVRGYTDKSGVIDHPLKEKLDKITDAKANPNKEAQEALTVYKRLATLELPFAVGRYDTVRYSLVQLWPQTGRKHQLRRHMKHISHHILGDTKYGRGEHNKLIRKEFGLHRLMLHAYTMELYHPFKEEFLLFRADFDAVFRKFFADVGWESVLEGGTAGGT